MQMQNIDKVFKPLQPHINNAAVDRVKRCVGGSKAGPLAEIGAPGLDVASRH